MPPKKKWKGVPQSMKKPGRAHQYLSATFSTVPSGDDVKNGHDLFLNLENNKTLSSTIQAVKDMLGVKCEIAPGLLKCLVNRSLGKYQNLGRDNDMARFSTICQENFSLYTRSIDEPEEPASTHPDEQEPECSQTTFTPPVLRSATQITPRKVKLKKRLDFVTKSKLQMQQKYHENIKGLKAKLKKPDRVKHLNQVIKRKEKTIRNLKEKMKNINLLNELNVLRVELNNIKRKHNKLKKIQKITVSET